MSLTRLPSGIESLLKRGTVIPAHPLALDRHLKMDERRQRALTRYYIASGAGGVAVGVHTTQFEIRERGHRLLEPVLAITASAIEDEQLERPFIRVAGICGPTEQALQEAELAVKYGYHLGLVSMGGLGHYTEAELIRRVEEIAKLIPVFGFYLQPAVGGLVLSYEFWQAFAEIPNVCAIKVAAFNRYHTLDVVRAVANSSRVESIALYTGNDDNIVADLLTPYRFEVDGQMVEKRFVGGLLGHWAVWTSKAVEIFNGIKLALDSEPLAIERLLSKGIEITDMNAVIFDAKNGFKGCIAGIHEVLRRQGLLEGNWCLSPTERMSAGQAEELDRVYRLYGSYTDDDFAKKFVQS